MSLIWYSVSFSKRTESVVFCSMTAMMLDRMIYLLPGVILFSSLVDGQQPRHVLFIHDQEENLIKPYYLPSGFTEWRNDVLQTWIVDATYHDRIEDIGWAIAEFTLNPDLDAKVTAYGAGYAEGYLSHQRISQHWNNTLKGFCDKSYLTKSCRKIHNFLQENLNWMKTMIKNFPHDPYWNEVNKALLQVQGLIDGFHSERVFNPTIRLEPFGLMLFQLDGDLADLEVALNITKRFFKQIPGSGSCSGFVKMLDSMHGKRDLFSSHSTWTDYTMMLRMMKRFNFHSYTEAFSGYPGPIFSGDDFNILSSGLVTMETTNGNNNPKLWKYVSPNTTLEWMRTIVANRLAKNGQEWCEIFAKHNSGTYNNQWMIVDYNAFESNKKNGILHVLEQLPGQIVYRDVTEMLINETYWASYNIPYFESIFNNSGQQELVRKYGDWFTHDKNPRARIFKRDQEKVTNIENVISLMRYNDFKNDPLSKCKCTPPYSAVNAIAARCDLNLANGSYPFPVLKQRNHGATDVKATSSIMRKSFAMVAECGPTHDQQPVFEWSKSPYANVSHAGHPEKFDFKPELIVWGK